MRFSSSLLISITFLCRAAYGNPLEARSAELTAVEAALPSFEEAVATTSNLFVPAAGGVQDDVAHVAGTERADVDIEDFKRSEVDGFGEEEKRSDLEARRKAATLVVCSKYNCKGSCYGYSLANLKANQCYKSHSFKSVRIQGPNSGLPYYVAVGGYNCGRTGIRRVNTCYNFSITGHTFTVGN